MHLFICVCACVCVCLCRHGRMQPLAELDCLQCSSRGANTFDCCIGCTSLRGNCILWVYVSMMYNMLSLNILSSVKLCQYCTEPVVPYFVQKYCVQKWRIECLIQLRKFIFVKWLSVLQLCGVLPWSLIEDVCYWHTMETRCILFFWTWTA